MKKKYQKPSIKVKEIETESQLMDVSASGNTGIGTKDGDGGHKSADSKRGILDFDNEPSSSSSIWSE